MKTILLAILLATSSTVLAAGDGLLKKGDGSVYPAKVTLTGMRSTGCPGNSGAQCGMAFEAELSVQLGGCLDRLGPVSSNQTQTKDGKIQLNISATAISNKASLSAFCIRAPTANITVFVGGGFSAPEVVLNDLNASAK